LAIRTLREQEQIVTTFYSHQGLTLREIGDALNVTEVRVSQILGRALLHLLQARAEDAGLFYRSTAILLSSRSMKPVVLPSAGFG